MKKTKLTKEQEILFEVYDKGVQNKDCNLDAYVEKMKKALNLPSILNETIEYVEQTTKEREDEWGSCRSLQEIKDAKDMPDIYYKLIALKNSMFPTVLSLEEILRDAVRRQAAYQVQFADYDLNTWTAPCILTQNRMDKLIDDASIRKIRLELEF